MKELFENYKHRLKAKDKKGEFSPYNLEKGSFYQTQTCIYQARHVLQHRHLIDRTEIADCLLTGVPERIHVERAAVCRGPIDGKCPFQET